jgi:hypothetical protein
MNVIYAYGKTECEEFGCVFICEQEIAKE